MSYIGDMTTVLLDEIDMAEKLLKYSKDKAYGIWFMAKADELIKQIQTDFEYYVEVTDIKKKSASDKVAESVYLTLKEKISGLTDMGISGDNLGINS